MKRNNKRPPLLCSAAPAILIAAAALITVERVNVRIGAHYEKTRFGLFAENVFDNRAYRSSSPAFD